LLNFAYKTRPYAIMVPIRINVLTPAYRSLIHRKGSTHRQWIGKKSFTYYNDIIFVYTTDCHGTHNLLVCSKCSIVTWCTGFVYKWARCIEENLYIICEIYIIVVILCVQPALLGESLFLRTTASVC